MATTRTTAGTRNDTAEVKAEVKVPLNEVRKPLYASLGAADLAVEKLLALPGAYGTEVRKISDRVVSIPTQASRVPTTVQTALAELSGRATELYNSFADRGEKRVSGVRKSPATKQAAAQTKTAVSQTKAARTSTRKAASAVTKAASEAAPGN